ncbi:ATP-binding protein [Bremerella alba]|uniref:histidine kinase n=1 Tax=Bremerella alba TaxID=980252 RepID=A0A7V8V213_9BACT|nr:ATP-binding protein [Bremerella alba]MBA2113199.1 Sensor histidine kinase RcsC [Bremerella alba]
MSRNSDESGGCSIDEVITTAALANRPSRSPDFAAENQALLELGSAFADSPKGVLQKLADIALELCGAGSSGISIAEAEGDQAIFRWRATAGEFQKYYLGTMPRDFSPCGVVLQRDDLQVMSNPARAFPYIASISPQPLEVLLVPFYRQDQAIGTVWVVSHSEHKKFDAEDARIVKNLAQFASAAVQNLQALEESENVANQVSSQQKALEQIEQDLLETQRRLQSTLSAAEVATWTWEIASNRVVADKNLIQMFGISPEIANGGPIEAYFAAIHPEDQDAVQRKAQRAIETGSEYEAIYRVQDAKGELRWVIARGSVERDEYGIAARLPGVVVDVTRQKEAENLASRLAHESDQLRRTYETALSNTADLNFVCDGDGKFTYVNKAFLDLWQKEMSDVVGQSAIPSQSPNDITERFQNQIQTVIQTRKSLRDEATYQTPDGVRQYESIIQPVLGEGGNIEAVVGSSRDITQRKEFEQHLLETHRQKDEFLATLAHELRNPLAPIRTGLQLLKFDHVSEEDATDAIDIMERQIAHLVHLVDDLLDVSRVTSGKIILRNEPVDLRSMIKSALEMCRSNMTDRHHRWTVEQPESPVLVNGDAVRLTQILTNVINNSCKYTPDGGLISLSLSIEAGHAIVKIRDNGIGIPDDLLSQVFEIFKQVEPSLDRAQGGLGLGLTLSQRLVEMHGGTIRADSAGIGQGSTITISLPTTVHSKTSMQDKTPLAASSTGRSLKILAVDDNVGAARLLSKLLSKLGDHDVDVAHDGNTVLRKAAEDCPDLIIMDIGMPGMNGYEVARKLRQMPEAKDTFLVALTGYGQDSDRNEARSSGYDEHLTKPPSLDALQDMLRHPKLHQ